jgi:hypothetical protein
MAKHSVSVFKAGDKVYVRGDDILIILPFDTEQFFSIYNGDKVTMEIEVQDTAPIR